MRKAMGGEGTPFSIEIPNVPGLMSAATLLAHSSYLAQLDGETDRSLEASTAGLRFASHLEDLPFLLGVLVRANIVDRTLAPMESAALNKASDEALAAHQQALRESSIGASVPFAIESEIRGILFAFHLVRTERGAEVGALMRDTPHSLPPVLWAAYGWGPLRWWGNWDEVLMLALMTDALESSKHPPHEALPDLRRIDREVERLVSRAHPMLVIFPSIKGTVERVATTDNAIARARIRIALESYRRKQRAFPQSLQELVPGWLEAVPLHVLSGKPFVYTHKPDGYELTAPLS
jgi:hypothetical protein